MYLPLKSVLYLKSPLAPICQLNAAPPRQYLIPISGLMSNPPPNVLYSDPKRLLNVF